MIVHKDIDGLQKLNISFHNSLLEITEEEWTRVTGNLDPESRYGYFRAMEEGNLQSIRFCYLIHRNVNGIPDGILPLYEYRNLPLETGSDSKVLNILLGIVRRVFNNFFKVNVLFAGGPINEANYLYIDDSLTVEEKKTIGAQLIKAAAEVAKAKQIYYIAFKDFKDGLDLFCAENAPVFGRYLRSISVPNNELENRWETFDEYVVSLKHSYRRTMKKNLQVSEEYGLIIRKVELDNLDNLDYRLIEKLYLNTFDRAPVKMEILNHDFFDKVLHHMKENAGIFVAEYQGDIIGFLLFVMDRNMLIVKRVGMDYNKSNQTLAYFSLFYQAIRHGIESGVEKIVLGQLSYHSKSRWGANIVPSFLYVRGTTPLRDKIINMLLPALFASYEDSEALIKEKAG